MRPGRTGRARTARARSIRRWVPARNLPGRRRSDRATVGACGCRPIRSQAGGRVFTLDSGGTRSGNLDLRSAALWTRDLTPPGQRAPNASGGGLAVAGDRLYVTSVYGFLAALDAATGEEIWRQRFDAPVTGAPTVAGDRVFVSAADSTLWAIDTASGRIDWSIAGARTGTLMARGPAPAISGDLAIMPTGAGELLGVRRANGAIVWDTTVVGRRPGAAYAEISSISGDPVVDGGRVYAANQSGRVMALEARNGDRIWSAREAAYGPVWPVGGSVFIVSDENRLMRLSAPTASPIWAVELPLYTTDRPRRRAEIMPQHGPVLAGGRIWIASGDGILRGFDPTSGTEVTRLDVPGGRCGADRCGRHALCPGPDGRAARLPLTGAPSQRVASGLIWGGLIQPDPPEGRHELHPGHRRPAQCGQVHAVQPAGGQAPGAGR
jgi:outer membrane protein assembly factor BamB